MKNTPRIYVGPIMPTPQTNGGGWIDLTEIIDCEDLHDKAREITGAEEMQIKSFEYVPSRLIPEHGLNAVQILGFITLASIHGQKAARAYVSALDRVGMVDDHPPEEWVYSFEDSHEGYRDSLTDWARGLALSGLFGKWIRKVMKENPGYLDVDTLRRELELNDHREFVRIENQVHAFRYNDLT